MRLRRALGWLRSLRLDGRGSALPLMAAGLIPAIGSLGAAIDAGRLYIVKSQLQAGADAAALAGARAFAITDTSSNSRTAQVNAYFDGNFPRSPSYMGTTNVVVAPEFQVVNGINVTTVTASATVPMSFMRLFGNTEERLTAVAKAELQPRPLEVMMVLDNTGSMQINLSAGRTRIMALKEAANAFVDILFQGGTTRRDLALGIIPYDITVNVGHLLETARPGSVQKVDGFNAGTVAALGPWPANPYNWKGCVMNDATVKDVSDNRTVSEAGAWDLTRTLPGEGGNPAVQPYFIPPMYVPKLKQSNADAAAKAKKDGEYYLIASGEAVNNLYKLDVSPSGTTDANYLANTALYRKYFYDHYIGLNDGSGTSGDDVIRATGGGYLDPAQSATTSWYVDWTRIPNYDKTNMWKSPSTSAVNPIGGSTSPGDKTTPMPSPNWQCPEEALPVVYGRSKSAYTDYITNKNAAIYPANGTIHHTGLLWGYRLLVRDTIFTRTSPTTEAPRRAIVFMTDGINEINENQNGYTDRTFTWYGRWTDGIISTSTNGGTIETQMMRRFSKTCANIQREPNPPEIYIIALVTNSTEVSNAFNACAPGRVFRTNNTAELVTAFQTIASELVDLHLVQ